MNLWHPYDSAVNPAPVFTVRSALGLELELATGERLLDAVSSWWCVAHGHRHPAIIKAMQNQMDRMTHVMFAGLTHESAETLARHLVEIAPGPMDKVFFSDSGSVAVEVAVKMALQYQTQARRPSRCRLFTLRGGYHGDTLGTMALGDPDGMHQSFAKMMPANIFGPRPEIAFDQPWRDDAADEIKETFFAHRDEVAAVIVEPVFQGAGGMRFYHPEYLRKLRMWCDELEILLIFDEIATGFWRTGRRFAADYAGVAPDILCLGKALTGGAITLAATLCRAEVAAVISRDGGKLMHGPTFMANPLACAAGCASLELFAAPGWLEKVAAIEKTLRAGLEPARNLANVADVRVLGAVGVIELVKPVRPADIRELLLKHRVWLRPFDRYLYTMPPLVSNEASLRRITAAMCDIAGR